MRLNTKKKKKKEKRIRTSATQNVLPKYKNTLVRIYFAIMEPQSFYITSNYFAEK